MEEISLALSAGNIKELTDCELTKKVAMESLQNVRDFTIDDFYCNLFKNSIYWLAKNEVSEAYQVLIYLLRNSDDKVKTFLTYNNLSLYIGAILSRFDNQKSLEEIHDENMVLFISMVEKYKADIALGNISLDSFKVWVKEELLKSSPNKRGILAEMIFDLGISELFPLVLKEIKDGNTSIKLREVSQAKHKFDFSTRKLSFINMYNNLGDLNITFNQIHLSTDYLIKQEGYGYNAQAVNYECLYCDKNHAEKVEYNEDLFINKEIMKVPCPFCGYDSIPHIFIDEYKVNNKDKKKTV